MNATDWLTFLFCVGVLTLIYELVSVQPRMRRAEAEAAEKARQAAAAPQPEPEPSPTRWDEFWGGLGL